MDTRPVFSPELVRPIENALMKAKAAMMPQAQLPGRPRPGMPMPPHRNTPTPPGMTRSASGTPNFTPQPYQHPHGAPPNGHASYGQHLVSNLTLLLHTSADVCQPYSQHTTPQPMGSSAPYQPPAPGAYGTPTPAPQAGVHIETLSNDIQNLVVALRAQAAQSPHDASVQTRLKALLDLQSIVQSTTLPQDQLDQIRNQVTELAAVTLRASSQTQNPAAPPPQQYVPPAAAPQAQPAPSVAPPTQGSVTLDSLLGPGALAALMARQSSQNSTPNPPPASSAVRSPVPAQAALAQATPSLSLMDQLRQAGMIPSTTPTNAAPTAPPPAAAPSLPASVLQLLSAQKGAGTPVNSTPYGLDAASLKQP